MLDFENVFNRLTDGYSTEIKSFWGLEGAIGDYQEAERRVKQVVYVAKSMDSGRIAAVSTAELKQVKALNNNYLYELRCFVGRDFRIAGLDVKISHLTLEYLEKIYEEEPQKPIGVFSVVENKMLKTESAWRRAVWPELKMQFIGFTSKGDHVRVRYFQGVRI